MAAADPDLLPWARALELEGEQRAAETRARLDDAVAVLVGDFAVRRVWLFGSLTEGALEPGSDVDLAVEGLAPERLFEAMARVEGVVGRPVDLVPTEKARPEVLERILLGELLYGAS